MGGISFKREPVIFASREAVQSVIDERIPNIAEDNCFKVCHFCGPGWTHEDGCKAAITMFEELHPEFSRMPKFNEWLDTFRLGAGFRSNEKRSIVIFLSTVSMKEIEKTYIPLYEVFRKEYEE